MAINSRKIRLVSEAPGEDSSLKLDSSWHSSEARWQPSWRFGYFGLFNRDGGRQSVESGDFLKAAKIWLHREDELFLRNLGEKKWRPTASDIIGETHNSGDIRVENAYTHGPPFGPNCVTLFSMSKSQYPATRLLVQLVIMGSGMLGRAVVQAYRQALTNASKSGVAQETLQNAVKRGTKNLTEKEARLILGVSDASSFEEILQKYNALFENNHKNGSFYLQSKVQRVKELLEEVHQAKVSSSAQYR